MAHTGQNKELIKRKQELTRLLDKEKNPVKRQEYNSELNTIDKKILDDAMKLLKMPAPFEQPNKKEFTDKELRRTVREKHDYYKEITKEAWELYNYLVAKKREGKQLHADLKGNNSDAMVEKTLRY